MHLTRGDYMVIKPKIYADKLEQLVDFVVGFVVWGAANGPIFWLTIGLGSGRGWQMALSCLGHFALPLAANVAVLAALWKFRRWMALGGIAGLGVCWGIMGFFALLFIAVISAIGRGL